MERPRVIHRLSKTQVTLGFLYPPVLLAHELPLGKNLLRAFHELARKYQESWLRGFYRNQRASNESIAKDYFQLAGELRLLKGFRLTPRGRALIGVMPQEKRDAFLAGRASKRPPLELYDFKERLMFLWLWLRHDGDVLLRIFNSLGETFTRSNAVSALAHVFIELGRLYGEKYIRLGNRWLEQINAHKYETPEQRVTPRLEAFVDLGFLTVTKVKRKFLYSKCEPLHRLQREFQPQTLARDLEDEFFVKCARVFNIPTGGTWNDRYLCEAHLNLSYAEVAPLFELCLVAGALALSKGVAVSLRGVKRRLIDLMARHPTQVYLVHDDLGREYVYMNPALATKLIR